MRENNDHLGLVEALWMTPTLDRVIYHDIYDGGVMFEGRLGLDLLNSDGGND